MSTEEMATGQATGTLFPHDATAENPHVYNVFNPTAADIAAAANKDDYPRLFGNRDMSAFLVYHTNYRPQSEFHQVSRGIFDTQFVGNRNPKYRNPRYQLTSGDDGLDIFREWWCKLPNTIAERKYLHGQLRDVLSALLINDIPLAIALLADINLATGDGSAVAEHVKLNLIKALEASMFPSMWDYMDPETRPQMPYTPQDLSNSGTSSGTDISGTSVTVSTA